MIYTSRFYQLHGQIAPFRMNKHAHTPSVVMINSYHKRVTGGSGEILQL